MHNSSARNLVIFIVLCSLLILLLASFIGWIIYRYQQKQNAYFKNLEEIKVAHENILLHSQVEIQELTFQNISREIHDNIGQKLAMAKLLLNTLPENSPGELFVKVASSVEIISQVVTELSNLSRSMSNEVVLQYGLVKATEAELEQIRKTSVYEIVFEVSDKTVFLEAHEELVLFRVIQESLHNIIKHAQASAIKIKLEYGENFLFLSIADNGKGFNIEDTGLGTGIKNMKKRIQLLSGVYTIDSIINKGTKTTIKIPYYENKSALQNNTGR